MSDEKTPEKEIVQASPTTATSPLSPSNPPAPSALEQLKKVGRPKGLRGKLYDYLEAKEVTSFFSAIPESRTDHILIFRLMANCGLRISEIVGLEKAYPLKDGTQKITKIPPLMVHDISLERRVIKIQGKGMKRRDVTFEYEPSVDLALRRHMDIAKPVTILVVNPRAKAKGGGYNEIGVWRLMKKYAKDAGINRPWSGPGAVSPHLLRHTYVTQALMAGADINWVQLQVGHDDLATTQIYRNLVAVAKARAEGGVPKLPY